jgi:hypothetical protein
VYLGYVSGSVWIERVKGGCTQCAKRPCCVIVRRILSVKACADIDVSCEFSVMLVAFVRIGKGVCVA